MPRFFDFAATAAFATLLLQSLFSPLRHLYLMMPRTDYDADDFIDVR